MKSRIGSAVPAIVAVLVSVLLGAAVALGLNHRLDPTLRVSTDIIGYPIFHAFNPFLLEERYQLTVIVFPAVTIAALLAASLLWRRVRRGRALFPDWRGLDPARAAAPPVTKPVPAVLGSFARVLTVGLVFGVATTVARGDQDFRVGRDLVAVALVYAAAIGGGVYLRGRRRPQPRWASLVINLARINAVGGALSIVGIAIASAVTEVHVAENRAVHHYAWLPMGLGMALVVGSVGMTVLALRRAHDNPRRVATVERRAVFLVSVPVGLFLLSASLPGVVDQFSAFEWGQSLTTLRLVQHGAFPWRDWVSTHGLLEDVLQPVLGSSAIQDSYWGVLGGYSMFVVTGCLLSLYFLAYRVFQNCWLLLVALGIMFFDAGYATTYLRFAFWPLLLILLGAVIHRRNRWLALLLGGALMVQAVLSQETAYCLPAVGVVLVASDATRIEWRRRNQWLRGLSISLWAAGGGALVAAVLFVVLLSQHALGDFVRFYTAFVPGHTLTGGIPHYPLSGYFLKEALLPILAMLAAIALVAARLFTRVRLGTLEWMLIAATLLEILYYPKFLDRADPGHVNEAFVTAMPLFLLLTATLLRVAESLVVRVFRLRVSATAVRYSIAAAAVFSVVLAAPVSIASVALAAPTHFRVTAPNEPETPALGYTRAGVIDPSVLTDVSRFLHAYMMPGDHLFDFTNEPGVLFYVLDFQPSTSYYEISPAMREVIQQDVIQRLRADRPLFVVFAQAQFGLPEWDDVHNMVRHYDISQYLLAHYRPFADIDGQVIYADSLRSLAPAESVGLSLSAPVIDNDLPFRGPSCDWGDAPNYLSLTPSSQRGTQDVAIAREASTSYVLRLPPGQQWRNYRWFEMKAVRGFSNAPFTLSDRLVPGEHRDVTFATLSGTATSYRFPIAACSQWWGYGTAPLHLSTSTGQEITSVQLLP